MLQTQQRIKKLYKYVSKSFLQPSKTIFDLKILEKIKRQIVAYTVQRELKSHINNIASKPKAIKKIGILMKKNTEISNMLTKALVSAGYPSEQLHFFSIDTSKEEEENSTTFSSNDFNFYARPNKKIQAFCEAEYDLLINYFTDPDPYLKLLSLKTKSQFRVGFAAVDHRLNDLIFSLEKEDLKLFCQQMNIYLNQINAKCKI